MALSLESMPRPHRVRNAALASETPRHHADLLLRQTPLVCGLAMTVRLPGHPERLGLPVVALEGLTVIRLIQLNLLAGPCLEPAHVPLRAFDDSVPHVESRPHAHTATLRTLGQGEGIDGAFHVLHPHGGLELRAGYDPVRLVAERAVTTHAQPTLRTVTLVPTPANYVDTPATGTSLRIRRAGSVPLVSISKHNLTQGPDGMLALLAIEESQAPLHVPDSGSGIIAFLAHILIVCRL